MIEALTVDRTFNPAITFDCGQSFRWEPIDPAIKIWIGTVRNHVLMLVGHEVRVVASTEQQSDSKGEFTEFVERYFSSSDNEQEIHESFPNDPYLKKAATRYHGLRILTQDPWECLITFVCSINCNIESIKSKVRNLSQQFGSPIRSDFGLFHTFPEPDAISKASDIDLIRCKVGFRWKYIKFIARMVSSGELNLDSLNGLDFKEARGRLVSKMSGLTLGVGPKVADCVLLFSFHRMEAFPIDVWMLRCLRENYAPIIEKVYDTEKNDMTTSDYYRLSELMRQRFGKYAGYAQQYLYLKIRNDAIYSK